MTKCDLCRHCRPARDEKSPLVALRLLVASGEPQIHAEFERIANEEYANQKAESDFVIEVRQAAAEELHGFNYDFYNPPQELSRKELQDFRNGIKPSLRFQFNGEPLAETHCAVHAAAGVYYVPDVKNWANTCEHFDSRDAEPDCQLCTYYRTTGTEDRKRNEADGLISIIGSNDPGAASILEKRSNEIQGGIAPAKANELRMAYNRRGRVQGPLEYLPYCESPCPDCAKLKRPNRSCRICHGQGVRVLQPEVFNRFLGCQVFRPDEEQGYTQEPGDLGGAVVRPAASPQVLTNEPAAAELAARGHGPSGSLVSATPPSGVQQLASQAVGAIFDHVRKLRNEADSKPAAKQDPNEVPDDLLEVIVPGQPPLTNEMLRRSVAMAKMVVGGTMPPGGESDYSQFVGVVWRRNMSEAIRLQLNFIQMYGRDRSDPQWVQEARQIFQSLAAAARKSSGGTGQRVSSAASGTTATAPNPSVATKTCKNGHSNPGNRIFCQECGKPFV